MLDPLGEGATGRTMNLTLLLLLEGIILFFSLVTLVIVSPNVKTRSDAIKDGSVHQQERERAAWLSADGQYLRDHPLEKWPLPRTMIVFVAALGLTFLFVFDKWNEQRVQRRNRNRGTCRTAVSTRDFRGDSVPQEKIRLERDQESCDQSKRSSVTTTQNRTCCAIGTRN